MINKALSHLDVLMMTGLNECETRSDVSLLDQKYGFIPIFCAPMEAINSIEHSVALIENGFVSCFHRYNSLEERCEFVKEVASYFEDDPDMLYRNGVAIGYADGLKEIKKLHKSGCKFFNLDVASCYHTKTFSKIREIGKWISENDCILMVGNTDNPEFLLELTFRDLHHYVDYLKIGIGSGAVCSTKIQTGVGRPTFDVISECQRILKEKYLVGKIKLVADGGLKNPGDCSKMFGIGASGVMLGSYFSGLEECPNKVWNEDGTYNFRYYGMASRRAKTGHFEEIKNIEGASYLIPPKNKSIQMVCKEMTDGLQSSISMCGFKSLEEFIGNGRFVRISSAGQTLSAPHQAGIREDSD